MLLARNAIVERSAVSARSQNGGDDALALTGIGWLRRTTTGRPEVVIGLIDGPVEGRHPDLADARLQRMGTRDVRCRVPVGPACRHGTFIAGMLSARPGGVAPALCPDCTLLCRPIFCEAADPRQCPVVTSADLAEALTEVIEAGARVVNLSVGLASTALEDHPELHAACDLAARRGVVVVCAAGNQGHVGRVPLFDHPWVVSVAGCDMGGRPLGSSNLGVTVGRRGLLAPGVAIDSTAPSGGYARMGGTSVAAPWVTGAAALLWSLWPQASAGDIRRALLLPDRPRRSVVPPLLDAAASRRALEAAVTSRGV